MKPKALIIVPKSEAGHKFLVKLPPDTHIEIISDDMYKEILFGFDKAAKVREEAMPPVDLVNFDDLEDPKGPTKEDLDVLDDFGDIDTTDGC